MITKTLGLSLFFIIKTQYNIIILLYVSQTLWDSLISERVIHYEREVNDLDNVVEDVEPLLVYGEYDRKKFVTDVLKTIASKYEIRYKM